MQVGNHGIPLNLDRGNSYGEEISRNLESANPSSYKRVAYQWVSAHIEMVTQLREHQKNVGGHGQSCCSISARSRFQYISLCENPEPIFGGRFGRHLPIERTESSCLLGAAVERRRPKEMHDIVRPTRHRNSASNVGRKCFAQSLLRLRLCALP